ARVPHRVYYLEKAFDLLMSRSDTVLVTSNEIADWFLSVDNTGRADLEAALNARAHARQLRRAAFREALERAQPSASDMSFYARRAARVAVDRNVCAVDWLDQRRGVSAAHQHDNALCRVHPMISALLSNAGTWPPLPTRRAISTVVWPDPLPKSATTRRSPMSAAL